MTRKRFLQLLATLPLSAAIMKLRDLDALLGPHETSERMPVLFIGHGSPMNAIEENEFVAGFRRIGQRLPRPRAVLCISAHWETRGTWITAMEKPRTIHDFGGFPKALYEVQYPAPGSPALAQETAQLVKKTHIGLDQQQWGLDHGAWTVIMHLFPEADVPVVQMSLDYTQPPQWHYELGQELAALRRKGVLIIGSGNMVHNLRMVAWDRLNDVGYAYDWATEASEKMKAWIREGNHQPLIHYATQGTAFQLAIPTPEHYLPLLYALALRQKDEPIELFNDRPLGGSLTMTSVKIG